MDSAPASPTDVLDRTAAMAVRLLPAIERYNEAGAAYDLAGPPGVALFERDGLDHVSHVSGAPSPDLAGSMAELHQRALQDAGMDGDNSHLLALVLLCMYVADEDPHPSLSRLREFARRPTEIVAIDEEQARHDPPLEPHDAALRAWTPMRVAGHGPDEPVHTAVLEMRFRAQRRPRYAPW